jgi:molybdopterin converting factor small subunit
LGVRTYGVLKDVIGPEVKVGISRPLTVRELLTLLNDMSGGGLEDWLDKLRVAVNGEVVESDDTLIKPGDDVALLPPSAGG